VSLPPSVRPCLCLPPMSRPRRPAAPVTSRLSRADAGRAPVNEPAAPRCAVPARVRFIACSFPRAHCAPARPAASTLARCHRWQARGQVIASPWLPSHNYYARCRAQWHTVRRFRTGLGGHDPCPALLGECLCVATERTYYDKIH
jgi:hypothetical protein